MEYPFLIIMDLHPESGGTSCVDCDYVTKLKVANEDTDDLKKEQTSEILMIPEANDKQHLYRCQQVGCRRAYSTEHELRLHEVICCNEKTLTCDICKETFKNKYTLRIHMYLHQELSSRKKYSCPYDSCPRYYYVKRSFDSHIKSHEGKKFECTYPGCGKKLSRQWTLNKHMLVHRRKEHTLNKTMGSAVPEFMCYICKRSFETETNLERHMSDHQDLSEEIFTYSKYEEHLNDETNMQKRICPHNGFPCDICKKSSITMSDMQSYMFVHQKEDFFCYQCKRKLQTKEELERHMFLHEGKGFPCNKCGRVLTRKMYLKKHMLLLHEDKVPCDICGKMKTKEQLKIHMSVHLKEKFCCVLCKRHLKTQEDLEKHMFLHEGQRFPCSMCGKVFKRKDNVSRHMLLHNGEKVSCDICKKMLIKRQLKIHMSQHFKEFPCNMCNRTFACKGNLLRHISLHNGEVFPCEICKKVLLTKEQMETHMSLHQIKMFTCDICKALFTTLHNMHRHMSLHKQEDFLGVTCSKLFRTNHHVPYYQRKIFTCGKCKINFASKTRMQEHVCLQTEVSPHAMCKQGHMTDQKGPSKNKTFHCHICRRCFKNKSVMQQHLTFHHKSLEKEVYVCDICKREFWTKRGLEKHLSFHKDLLGEKRFFCSYSNCSKGYVYRRNLSYHIKRAHGGKESKDIYVDDSKELASKEDAASTDSIEEHKQTVEGMQTRGENTRSSLTTSSQKYEHGRKWLLEKKNMLHESLKLKSQQYKGERDKGWLNGKVLIEPLHTQRNGHISKQSPSHTETEVQRLCDSRSYVSENSVPSGNHRSECDFEIQEDVELTNIEQEEGLCSGVDPLDFNIDVRERIYIMKRIMEEMFPTIKSTCL